MIIDKNSKEWREIEAFLTSKIDELRKENDNDLSAIETAEVRGQIKLAKLILTLPEEAVNPKVKDESYF